MKVQSLSYRSDLIFPGFDSEILDRGEYTVIRSQTNPSFYWNNFLLFQKPPAAGDLERWQSLFAKEIGIPPAVHHQTFGWDTGDGDLGEVQPFLDAGFRASESIVLAATHVHLPPHPNSAVTLRSLASEDDWEQAFHLEVMDTPSEHELEGYKVYLRHRFARHHKMARAGRGAWFGAFIGDLMVAGLGVYTSEDLGRFQNVITHPDYRRQGICGTLVHYASEIAFQERGVKTLVIIADEFGSPRRVYESVGYRPVERQRGLERFPGMGS